MADNSPPKTASQQLGAMVREKLVNASLIESSRANEFEQKLASGTLTQDDWKFLLERVEAVGEKGEE